MASSVNFSSAGFFNSVMPLNQTNWAAYFGPHIEDGVVAGIDDELEVYANSSGMVVYTKAGECRVRSHRGVLSSLATLDIAAADLSYDRIDLIVARVTYGTPSSMVVAVKTGVPAASPAVPALTQTAGDVWEIALAQVHVAANAVTIAAEDVKDMRYIYDSSTSVNFSNGDSVTLTKGMLVKLSKDIEGAVIRCPQGKAPIGVVASETIPVGGMGRIATISGQTAEISCDTEAVSIGDMLIPSATDGIAKRGSGYGGGLALAAKASGAVGNVRALLAIMTRIMSQSDWWLPTGIDISQVIAAWQFVGRDTEADALLNINGGTEYALSKVLGTEVWNAETGFTIPGTQNAGLNNDALVSAYSGVLSAAFGYNGATTPTSGAHLSGGLIMHQYKNLELHTLANGARRYPTITRAPNTNRVNIAPSAAVEGVLAGNFTDNSEIFRDGSALAMSQGDIYVSTNANVRNKIFGQINETGESWDGFNVTALVLYNTNLTASQMMELSQNIKSLGGAGV